MDRNTFYEQRNAIGDALVKAIAVLTTHKENSFDDVMSKGVSTLAGGIGADSVVIYNVLDVGGKAWLGQVYAWSSTGAAETFSDSCMSMAHDCPVVDNWYLQFSEDKSINNAVKDMSADEQEFLSLYNLKSIMMLPVFCRNKLWGIVTFQSHVNDYPFNENYLDIYRSAAYMCVNAIIHENMSRSADESISVLQKREKMMDALNRAAITFLSRSEEAFEETMTTGMRLIVDVMEIDRISVWRNSMMSDGLHAAQVYMWDRVSGGTTQPFWDLEDINYAKLFPRWETLLGLGDTINCPVSELPERELLSSFGVVSVFVTPVFINTEFWGIVLFEDRANERHFDEYSAEIMCSAAFLYANTIMRSDMERKLSGANKLTRSVIDTMPISLTVWDENANIIDCNDATCRLFDITKQYYIDHFSTLSPEYQPNGRRSDQMALDLVERAFKGETMVVEWEHQTPKGELIPCEVTLVGIMRAGRPAVLGYIYDLRRTKKMMNAIRRRGELLQERLKQQEMMSEISKSFILPGSSNRFLNTALERLGYFLDISRLLVFGINYKQKDAALAYSWYAENAPKKLVSKSRLFEMVMETFTVEVSANDNNMSLVFCDDVKNCGVELYRELALVGIKAFVCAPIYAEGILWGILVVEQCDKPRVWSRSEKKFISTVTSVISGVVMRSIYNEKLENALQQATAASKAKGEFLSNMSHEMRTPLNAIIGMANIGKNNTNIERKDYALSKIQDASGHLLGVINDVLDMSKIEANKLELSSVEFNFEQMVQKVTSMMMFRLSEKNQGFILNMDEKIPKRLIGDDQRLAQVITNLLANAVKFTQEGGDIILSVFCSELDADVCKIVVEVADNGIGISQEQQDKLFRAFRQAESDISRRYGGTGLGLAIAKRIVELMDGKIWVESELGKGSTFIFTVKMKYLEDTEKQSISDRKTETKDTQKSDEFIGKRLLLAEDVEVNREVFTMLLGDTGIVIDVAKNGQEALDMVAANPDIYDLILMDMQMPIMGGLEATQRIRALPSVQGKKLPIVAITANVFKEDIDECIAAGMDDHIGKPLNVEELFRKMRKYLY